MRCIYCKKEIADWEIREHSANEKCHFRCVPAEKGKKNLRSFADDTTVRTSDDLYG